MHNMHDMQRKKERQITTQARVCKLSELGKCKKRFKPKVPWQDFCCTEHQQLYWILVRKDKRIAIKLMGDHEDRIVELEERVKKLEENKNGK